MGNNFLGVEDIIKHFGVSIFQVTPLQVIPFPESELVECRNTHILFSGYPLTIRNIQSKVPKELFYFDKFEYKSEYFYKEDEVGLRWYLIRKDIFRNQIALLPDTEETPRACEVVYMAILYYLTYQEEAL